MLVRARGTADESLAAQLAALLTERDLLRAASDPDLRTRLEILRGEARGVDPGSVARVRELARRYGARGSVAAGADAEAGRLLAWAWPDRVAQRRAATSGAGAAGARTAGQRYLLSNGRGAEIAQVSTIGNAEYLVALDLDDAEGAVARIRLAAPLSRAQLDSALGNQVTESIETEADNKSGRTAIAARAAPWRHSDLPSNGRHRSRAVADRPARHNCNARGLTPCRGVRHRAACWRDCALSPHRPAMAAAALRTSLHTTQPLCSPKWMRGWLLSLPAIRGWANFRKRC